MANLEDKKIVYYDDPLEDEFAEAKIESKPIDEHYPYKYSAGRKILRVFTYRIVAIPLAYAYLKLYFGHKLVGREKLKGYKEGIYLYGNHTNAIADALIPTMVTMPKGIFVIVNPDNVSMPVLGKLTPSLGAIPLPGNMKATKNFMKLLKDLADKGKNIMIYPEAHIWPYYTGIRPFKDDSFTYPVKYHKPVFCFTNTYVKWGKKKRPRIVTYVDGPFFADNKESVATARGKLRDQVYGAMRENAKKNEVELVTYIQREK